MKATKHIKLLAIMSKFPPQDCTITKIVKQDGVLQNILLLSTTKVKKCYEVNELCCKLAGNNEQS